MHGLSWQALGLVMNGSLSAVPTQERTKTKYSFKKGAQLCLIGDYKDHLRSNISLSKLLETLNLKSLFEKIDRDSLLLNLKCNVSINLFFSIETLWVLQRNPWINSSFYGKDEFTYKLSKTFYFLTF